MERLPSHKETQIDKHSDDFSEGQSVENKVVKKEKEGVKRSGSRKSHLYLIHTLVTKYLYGLKNGTLAKIKVNIKKRRIPRKVSAFGGVIFLRD